MTQPSNKGKNTDEVAGTEPPNHRPAHRKGQTDHHVGQRIRLDPLPPCPADDDRRNDRGDREGEYRAARHNDGEVCPRHGAPRPAS